jgi:hypothetical protein
VKFFSPYFPPGSFFPEGGGRQGLNSSTCLRPWIYPSVTESRFFTLPFQYLSEMKSKKAEIFTDYVNQIALDTLKVLLDFKFLSVA